MLSWIWGGDNNNGEQKTESHLGGGVSEKVVFEGVTIQDCIDVLADYEKYPEFVEGNAEAKITKDVNGDGKTFDVFWKASVTLFTVEYTLRLTKHDDGVSWTETEHGPFKKNQGNWKLVDLGNGNVEATYTVNIELNMWVPALVKDWLIGKGLPRTLKAFKERIESKAKAKKQ
ncbi:hypothetical protein ABK040_012871 [Willaertia magna]